MESKVEEVSVLDVVEVVLVMDVVEVVLVVDVVEVVSVVDVVEVVLVMDEEGVNEVLLFKEGQGEEGLPVGEDVVCFQIGSGKRYIITTPLSPPLQFFDEESSPVASTLTCCAPDEFFRLIFTDELVELRNFGSGCTPSVVHERLTGKAQSAQSLRALGRP